MNATGRIQAEFTRKQRYIVSNNIEAYRLLSPTRFDPLAVDVYKDNAVVHLFGPLLADKKKELERELTATLHIKHFYYKDRSRPAGKSTSIEHKIITIREYGCLFEINLSDYLDTGLFLDHRETRKWIRSVSAAKRVANLFAYTGSFTVDAARGGAAFTATVDLSKTYCDWARRNIDLNGCDPKINWIYKMDALEFLRYCQRKKQIFDIVIIDPPSFSRNKGAYFSVQENHAELINEALPILSQGGFILFSTNLSDFKLAKDTLSAKSIEEKLDTIPPDFAGTRPHKAWVLRP